MSYFLRNFDLLNESRASITSPNVSLHSSKENYFVHPKGTSCQYAQLLKYCAKLPQRGHILRFPTARRRSIYTSTDFDTEAGWEGDRFRVMIVGEERRGTDGTDHGFRTASLDLAPHLEILAAPSTFGVVAIARAIILKYTPFLKVTLSSFDDNRIDSQTVVEVECNNDELGKIRSGGNELVLMGLKCMFSVLFELNRRESELCSEALTSLLHLLEHVTSDTLVNESYCSVQSMFNMLCQLAMEGGAEVSAKAVSCMIALAIAYGAPEFILSSVATLFCDKLNKLSVDVTLLVEVPKNHQKLANLVRRILLRNSNVPGCSGDWWSHCLMEHAMLSSFDVRIPDSVLPDTPDDRRLTGAIASDGEYVYVLACYGLFKYGTGLAETIEGKLYASNNNLKANKGSWLAICNGALYLRRRQSSRMWVIDVDTLREIGEIMLHTSVTSGTIFTDGTTFFQAAVDEQWTLTVTPLDDSFTPSQDLRQNQKFRLAELNYIAVGETYPIPHELPLTLPKSLQAQASDLQMNREMALLLARNGKVYYAGDGTRLGLQNVGCNWMKLVLPESIVSIAVGFDTETIVLRSGAGHLWIAGVGPDTIRQGSPTAGRFQKQEAGSVAVKLRKFQNLNRRRCLSVAVSAGCIAYVVDNGKAYVCGRHTMQCHPETGHIYGLENVHLASIALGKTHAVAISRHGHLYTWGLNNLNQCGRIESASSYMHQEVATETENEMCKTAMTEGVEQSSYCLPSEHLWVKDFASICLKCGRCSARGSRCAPIRTERDTKGTPCTCGEGETCCLRCGLCRACGEFVVDTFDQDIRTTPPRAALPPSRLILQRDSPEIKVSSVCCGNYHTVVLAADRQVFTFGSNCHGQLGVGHIRKCIGPHKVNLPGKVQVVQIAAGSNHTVLRTADGSVITFGAHRQGQLAREGNEKNWFAMPSFVAGYGRGSGTVATWIGASGDTTLIHSQIRIYSNDIISDCQIVADSETIIIFPNQIGKNYMAIRRKYNTFCQYSLGTDGLYTNWCLESKYNLLWAFNTAEMRIKSITDCIPISGKKIEADTVFDETLEEIVKEIQFLRAPEFLIPVRNETSLSSKHVALNLFGITYAATILESRRAVGQKDNQFATHSKASNIIGAVNGRNLSCGYQHVNRFDGYGGGWGYSAHSVEAIQFRTSRDIRFFGVGLYGGRGEYIAKLKLYRLCPPDYNEQNVELLSESDEMLYECAAHEKAQLLFSRCVLIKSNLWHVICAQINGPSSDCGSNGQSNVIGDDGVQFFFRNSRMSNNGTDVNVGQIPEFLYVSETSEGQSPNFDVKDKTMDISCDCISCAISSHHLLEVSTLTIESLFRLLDWSIQKALVEIFNEDKSWYQECNMIIVILSLRFLRFYICSLYLPSKSGKQINKKEPSSGIAEQMVRFASIIGSIFEIANNQHSDSTAYSILLEEAVSCAVQCSHVLYPSSAIFLDRLSFLMSAPNREWSLIALLSALLNQEYVLPTLLGSERSFAQFPILLTKMNEQMGKKRISANQYRLVSLQNVFRFLFEMAFTSATSVQNESRLRLRTVAHSLIIAIARELVTSKDTIGDGPPILQTPNRFRRTAAHASWDVSNGACDAIALSVDVTGITLHGVGVYCAHHDQEQSFVCEVLLNGGDAAHEQWNVLEKVVGTLANKFEPCQREVCLLRLTKVIKLQPGCTYAIRLQINGGKTFCGEGGIGTVRLCNGSRMHFESCNLSLNGTSLSRGQIPFVLYSIQDDESDVIQQLANPEQLANWFLLLIRMLSSKISDLIAAGNLLSQEQSFCSSIAGYIMVFLEANPQRALDVVAVLDDLLPMVSSANGERLAEERERLLMKSSHHNNAYSRSLQTVIESAHPYSSCGIQSQIVDFGKEVQFMTVQFSEECCTGQADDILWIYAKVGTECYVPIGRYYGDRNWPDRMLLIPGSNLWFIMESAYYSSDKPIEQIYGYRCTVTGYRYSEKDSDMILEEELTWICASACRLLVQIPSVKTVIAAVTMVEDEIDDIVRKHGTLLRKGLNLSHLPTVNEVLKRNLPTPLQTSDLKFLKEFITASANTVAGFLARWLMNEPVVDLHSSQLQMSDEETRLRIPTQVKLIPRDQYGRLVICPNMKVEITVRTDVASDNSNSNFYGTVTHNHSVVNLPQPQSIKEPYRPVFVNKTRYVSITAMTAYQDYCFEELRLGCYKDAIMKEQLTVSQQVDGSFLANWTPKHGGTYRIECRLDGFQLAQSYLVEVRDNNIFSGSMSSKDDSKNRLNRRVAHFSRTRFALCDQKLMMKGVRIRASPALNSSQIGVIPRGTTVSYIEEVENADGIWLRLTDEACAIYCDAQLPSQGWCLQYSNHLGRSFLLLQSDSTEDFIHDSNLLSTTIQLPQNGGTNNEQYLEQSLQLDVEQIYAACDSLPVSIYNYPSVDAICGDVISNAETGEIRSSGWIHNKQGIWIRLSGFDQKYAFVQDLAGNRYLQKISDITQRCTNGNVEGSPTGQKPIAQIYPRSRSDQLMQALKPSIADCCRTVFAAFLWHERLVKDAMVCSTYLKFHPELHSITFGQNRMELIMTTPMHSLFSIWQEINAAVQTSIEQRSVLLCPVTPRQFDVKPISVNIGASRQGSSSTQRKDLCELCEEWHAAPVTTHMRMAHPGCSKYSGGQGYNSSGKYTSGWSGNCGDGGRPTAVWYLMCATCRSKYLLQTPSGHQQERTRRWREFCASSAVAEMSPEAVIKQNAMFLMELNACLDDDSKDTSRATSGWTINLFPQSSMVTPPVTSTCIQTDVGIVSQPQLSNGGGNGCHLRKLSYASDPGPKHSCVTTHSALSNYNPLYSTRRLGSSPLTNASNQNGMVNSIRRKMLEGYERRQSAEIVQSPSVALKSLLVEQNNISGSANVNVSLRRPVLTFVMERHNLARIREAMATAVARATFFAHSFRVWNWLLKMVSTESSVADILWQYLTALNSYVPLCRWRKNHLRLATNLRLLPHPWRVCYLAGPVANKMVQQLHSFLHTVAVIVQSNGVNTNLRCLCFRVWTFQLTVHEQDLLSLICDVLASVGNVLADSSEDHSWNLDDGERKTDYRSLQEQKLLLSRKRKIQLQADVKQMEDITGILSYEASSRQAMIACLTDGNSETFWETGEEDKNRPRYVTVHCDIRSYKATLLTVYVDNIRDEGYRTCSVTVVTAESDGSRRKIHSECLDHQFIGWIKCCIFGLSSIQVIFRGNDPSLRIRQLRVFGTSTALDVLSTQSFTNRSFLKPSPSHQLLFNANQDDAFAVFQAIAAQAFSDEFSQEENGTLRQQVLDLLFSRIQLQPLQTFVCSHMISALEREVSSLREKAKRNYSYVCGLMEMLLKICSSRQGLEVFGVKNRILIILSELLLFAPQVVQCQVLETIECLSKLFTPSAVDCVNFTRNLLILITKVITLQIRDKMTRSLTSACLATHVTSAPMYWRIDRAVSTDIAYLAKQLLKNLSEGLLNEYWTVPVRTEIANEIMNLTSLNITHSYDSDNSGKIATDGKDESASGQANSSDFSEFINTGNSRSKMLKNGKFWLAVAALSLLKESQWLELSSVWQSLQNNKESLTRMLCDNHDDGRTLANVYCETCQCSLCRECFSVLHLNKRNRSHAVQHLGDTNDRPQVEVHEGSTRLRLPHVLILFNPTTLNGMVEFNQSIIRENIPSVPYHRISEMSNLAETRDNSTCRFCNAPLCPDQIDGLCNHEECRHFATFACQQQLPCGHICGGIRDEEVCLPCIQCRKPDTKQDADDLCVICFTDRLGGAPCIQLACHHIFHYRCVRTVLEKRWNGPRIVFRFMQCPLCKEQIDHPSVADLLLPLKDLYNEVLSKARLRLEYDGFLQSPATISESSELHMNLDEYAMERYMYVLCFKCGKAYFGGESRCQQELDNSQYNPEELICGGCSDVVGAQVCGRHGIDFLEFKCRFCCSVAVYFCFGTTHFCTACHDDFQRLVCLPKKLLPKCPVGPKCVQLDGSECPLRVKHPPTGEEFPLGCGICRNINTF
ncbi:B-box zinc finger family protein [Brugia malayi]|uniref:RCR-type E3 ubiquitin transferase n=2 Tax=Brugia TaxID=6278 RepID=A0A4E9FPC6_BRUMA|nr:B-box zinc finger family protein [Brugia malayi]VIO97478.1 B-box zinc finger family protein [Brugia malayi]